MAAPQARTQKPGRREEENLPKKRRRRRIYIYMKKSVKKGKIDRNPTKKYCV